MNTATISNEQGAGWSASNETCAGVLDASKAPRVLVVSSGGGHWVQLKRVLPAFEGCPLIVATVPREEQDPIDCLRQVDIPDATRWDRWRLVRLALRLLWLTLRERPDVVVTTGAAPGYFALRFGKWIGAKTIWIDSIANLERMSLSGERVQRYADLWLTQWAHLAKPNGPTFLGAVL